ncbi:MAG: hypothetical protein JXQ75_17810, partial [Phycisphaerae bacterium]|nr:hypothetical protein [Phycisphaerae bacterium]
MTAELTNDILQALLQATCEQKRTALQILRDEPADYPSSEPLLTLKQLSAKLNFHPSTLWRWQVPRHGFAG